MYPKRPNIFQSQKFTHEDFISTPLNVEEILSNVTEPIEPTTITLFAQSEKVQKELDETIERMSRFSNPTLTIEEVTRRVVADRRQQRSLENSDANDVLGNETLADYDYSANSTDYDQYVDTNTTELLNDTATSDDNADYSTVPGTCLIILASNDSILLVAC